MALERRVGTPGSVSLTLFCTHPRHTHTHTCTHTARSAGAAGAGLGLCLHSRSLTHSPLRRPEVPGPVGGLGPTIGDGEHWGRGPPPVQAQWQQPQRHVVAPPPRQLHVAPCDGALEPGPQGRADHPAGEQEPQGHVQVPSQGRPEDPALLWDLPPRAW